MIPRLTSHLAPATPSGFFERLIEAGFNGDAEGRSAARTVYATDNSIYQLEPAGILFPRDADDLKTLAKVLCEPAFSGMTITPRGGGTGTNGQSLTSGLVVDCSRHMNKILEIDAVRRVARVQAGVVKDQLNRALKPYGLFFAPELSTSNRATIGGMVSTDACGQGSCLYGKTSNHVLGLRIVLVDGSEWWSRALSETALADILKRKDRIGEIHRTVDGIAGEKRERIEAVFPKLNRYMTGYDLAHIRQPNGRFDLNAILCGSEGTLAMIAEAELNLLPLPAHAALINIRYNDFNAALEDARTLTALKVASIETVDEKVLGLAKKDIVWNEIGQFFPDDISGSANGINIVEILADDEAGLERALGEVTAALGNGSNPDRLGHTIARQHHEIEAIWTMRKRAVGLLGNVDGPVRPVAFVEDTAVPPENLSAYIREFRDLLDGAGLSYGMFGHVDAGVLHVRPALDLTREDHSPLVRQISDAVVALTQKYGGVLWGEHGKGVRSEYVPEFFGDLYPCLQEIKRAFDPQNRLNPGKIAAPSAEPLLKIDGVPLRGEVDRVIGNDIRAAFDNAAYCNGNGTCFDFDETSPMCPSYKATRDRRFSPKGRAALMREWLRLLADRGIDPRAEARSLRRRGSLAALPRRVFNSLDPRNRGDFSHEVRQAMDTCLACKACAGQCPVKVSVPAFRSKFLELYHGRYARSLKDLLVAAIETSLPWMARTRPLYNLIAGTDAGKRLMRLCGLTALPLLPQRSLKAEARGLGVPVATKEMIEGLPQHEKERAVVFVVDAFTAHFEPGVALSVISLARKMDLIPYLAEPMQNGKAMHVHGYLGRFEATATWTARYLQGLAEAGATLVGLDPSMTLVYRSEYKGLWGRGAEASVLLPQEWLAANLDRLFIKSGSVAPGSYRLLPHCTERSNAPSATALWKAVFKVVGGTLEIVDTGCCGMAGTFGHEVRNRATSEALYAMSWSSLITGASSGNVTMATGYSCRSQIKAIDHKAIPHPLEVIDSLIC
ncbi:D-2-hydroxyglutarate dehydrogenase YdiJ [Rhizobium laguerreae]|uniref:D-2-hydroxyglutarate dehydrogenase YdiJ n=1 Tax=Rhizobium laguerreae TaxID=1076926 RepID=UPI001C907D44|nr:FAD-binding and (Fe-S)-binding domain-containing protein [Rhizobium laguerreae]MBY3348404.1 FAD-binding oxidoreductase [Rhizobium laguerreae]MBY3355421.1 FAD-binding oxidoreductase [Rhizobium laguerreae]MBY3369264.1 FAD-binding oxidoreductase [Rhizobium laguerreae]MBY3376558.1 FAD-binding oxidoreductase [Rhizobium laguerreae]MBY3431737.1 FAD-binding oxidoreductase [Rhizobium laguerreae]